MKENIRKKVQQQWLEDDLFVLFSVILDETEEIREREREIVCPLKCMQHAQQTFITLSFLKRKEKPKYPLHEHFISSFFHAAFSSSPLRGKISQFHLELSVTLVRMK